MSSNNIACVNSNQLSLGLVLNIPNGNNLVLSFDSKYDLMLYNINNNTVTFYTNANQIVLPEPGNYVLAVLNPENNLAVESDVTYIPNTPPSQTFYGFVITQASALSSNSNNQYTINVNGVDIMFNPSIQSIYVGYGSETPILSSTLFELSSTIQQLEGYFPLQTASVINQVAEENPICGNLVGSPDNIVYSPNSSGVSQPSSQPFIFGLTFYPKVPPLPPSPPSTSNRDLVTLGIVGALAVAGAIVGRKGR
jgi:hypothetical protein